MVLYFKVLENLFPSIWDTLYVTVGHVISCQHLLKQYPLLFWRHQTISTFETLLFVSRQQDGHISILKNPKRCDLKEVDSFFIFIRRDVTFNYFRKISFLLHHFSRFQSSLFLSFYTSCGFFVTFRFEILRILFMLLVFWCLFEQQQKQEAIRRCRFRNRFHSSITLELKCESFFFWFAAFSFNRNF